MRIIIDNSNLFAGGGIQVATSFLYDLNRMDSPHNYYVIQSPNSSKQVEKEEFGPNFHFVDVPEKVHKNLFKRSTFVRNLENDFKPNVIFTTFGPSYYKSSCPKIVGFAIPHLVYPDSPYFKKLSLKERFMNWMVTRVKKVAFKINSDVLIFESEAARIRFQTQFKGNTYVVSNTLNEIFLNKNKWGVLNGVDFEGFKILCLTANYPHKNIDIIPKVVKSLVNRGLDNFRFYITISEADIVIEDDIRSYICFLNQVDLCNIPTLYSKMDCLIMPSLLEVFSTTYLEAMFMGLPIIASDMPFSRDVCSDGAIYCSPLDENSYAEAIIRLKDDDKLRRELVFRGSENLKRFGTSEDRTLKYLKIIENYENNK